MKKADSWGIQRGWVSKNINEKIEAKKSIEEKIAGGTEERCERIRSRAWKEEAFDRRIWQKRAKHLDYKGHFDV